MNGFGISMLMSAPFVGLVGGTSILQRKRVGAIVSRDLRPDDWQDIWPELAESEPKPTPAPANHARVAINSEARQMVQEVA